MLSELHLNKKNATSTIPIHSVAQNFNWYVFYTYPRAEKIVYNDLVKSNYEVFLPTTRSLKLWKNRQKKWIEQILFPGYIFVKTQESELFNITKTPKVVTYIHIAGKPSLIPSKEIEGIKKMLDYGEGISVETKFYEGDKVRIIHGPLSGHEGFLVNQKGKTRFGIQLKEINHSIYIDISVNILEKIKIAH